jgi:hypothetical protein
MTRLLGHRARYTSQSKREEKTKTLLGSENEEGGRCVFFYFSIPSPPILTMISLAFLAILAVAFADEPDVNKADESSIHLTTSTFEAGMSKFQWKKLE